MTPHLIQNESLI